jgi:predicted NBD/HSP70 family sugar kinase
MNEANGDGDGSRLDHEVQVLQALRRNQQVSQPTLARQTGLARGTVVNVVKKLAEKKLVEYGEPRIGPGGGRPGRVVWLRKDEGFGLAVHFGHRHVRVACGDLRGYDVYFFDEKSVPAASEAQVNVGANAQQSLEVAAALVQEAMAEMKRRQRKIDQLVAVTVGWPAPVRDVDQGEVVRDPSLREWLGMGPPAEELSALLGWQEMGIPFLTENDANLAALMELEHGIGNDHKDFIYVHWNSGIGAALVTGGRLQRGAAGFAGELGHVPLPGHGQGQRCLRCGSDHCLEVLAGGNAVVEKVHVSGKAKPDSLRAVIQLAASERRGADLAREVLADAAAKIAFAVGPLITVLNPTAVVIGGHFGRGEDGIDHFKLISEPFRSALRESTSQLALREVRSVGVSSWQYGAAQGGVVLGMRRKLARLAKIREGSGGPSAVHGSRRSGS